MGKVVPLFCKLFTTHTSSGVSNVWRYADGSYCLDSQVDLHSSTSRLYISTASSMSTYSHLMCDIISSVFNSLAGFILFLRSMWYHCLGPSGCMDVGTVCTGGVCCSVYSVLLLPVGPSMRQILCLKVVWGLP